MAQMSVALPGAEFHFGNQFRSNVTRLASLLGRQLVKTFGKAGDKKAAERMVEWCRRQGMNTMDMAA